MQLGKAVGVAVAESVGFVNKHVLVFISTFFNSLIQLAK